MRYTIWRDGSTGRWNIEDNVDDCVVGGNFDHESDAQKIADTMNRLNEFKI